MPILTLVFLHITDDEPCMNRLTAWVSKHPVCHVELGFENNMYFSIMADQTVILRHRTLENPMYESVSLQVSDSVYHQCYADCMDLSRRGITFDHCGLYGVLCFKWFPWFSSNPALSDIRATFCSKIITQLLQKHGVKEVMYLNPSSTSPSDLLDAVKGSYNNVIFSTRFNRPCFKLHVPIQIQT